MNRGLFILTDSVIAGGKGDIPAVSAKIFQQQLGHFVGDLPHDRTADIATVAAGAAGAVAVQADGEFIGIGDRVAIDQERNDPLTDWPRDIIGIGYPGIVIVIVVLHLGLQEAIRDPQGIILSTGEVGGAALHSLAQHSPGDAQHGEGIGIGVGDEEIPTAHDLRQAGHIIGQAGGGKLCPADLQLNGIEQVGQAAALRGHF